MTKDTWKITPNFDSDNLYRVEHDCIANSARKYNADFMQNACNNYQALRDALKKIAIIGGDETKKIAIDALKEACED